MKYPFFSCGSEGQINKIDSYSALVTYYNTILETFHIVSCSM